MSREVLVRPEADRELDGLADYLAQGGRDVGRRFLEKAHQAFRQLAAMPGLGVRVEVEHPGLIGLRCFPIPDFKNHLIFYRSDDEFIEILRVLHGARDIETILGDFEGGAP